MQKRMYGKVYDTDKATLIKKYTYGEFGDQTGYEECLFQSPEGFYFLFALGGTESPYPEATISRIGKQKVAAWLESH